MIEIADTSPAVHVLDEEYQRLLGYPPGAEMSERAQQLAAAARDWYARHGRPWVYARQSESAVLAAVSAGPELEEEAQKLWREEKPDEYFFLEIFGSAVVEHLVTITGARLCAWAEGQGLAVLPHRSPGYGDWDVAEQPRLLESIGPRLPGRLESLSSGALRPKKSQLAVFGLTAQSAMDRPLTLLSACQSCSFGPCQYRRAPYRRTRAAYATNWKALKRWAAERLSIEKLADGGIEARFRYDGTTCTNMGRPLTFDYRVNLGPREHGFLIREERCAPIAGDTGHKSMCEYLRDAEMLMADIDRDQPLLGQPLDDVLRWQRPSNPAGCYCDAAARRHKWGLVLETLHFALMKNS